MKSSRHRLAHWLGDYTDGYVDIPWPLVHDQAGTERISWLNRQDPVSVQIILEKDPKDHCLQSLWAEFYNDGKYSEYLLRFGLPSSK
jgi:hypothetical protein